MPNSFPCISVGWNSLPGSTWGLGFRVYRVYARIPQQLGFCLQAGLKASHGSAEYIRAIESRRSIKVSWKMGFGVGIRIYPLNPTP